MIIAKDRNEEIQMSKRAPRNMELFKKKKQNSIKIENKNEEFDKENKNEEFDKEIKTVALFITLYIFVLVLICIFFSNNKIVMNVLAYVLSPFTMGLTFFLLTTMKEKKTELEKELEKESKKSHRK